MLVRNIHLGIVVSTTGLPVVLGKMEWMSNSYLQCQQGETLNVFICGCMKTGRRYLDWMPNSGSVSRRIVMEKALIFYPIYWRWRCGVRWKVHVIRGADTMYNSRSSAETEVIASNFIRPQTMIAVV